MSRSFSSFKLASLALILVSFLSLSSCSEDPITPPAEPEPYSQFLPNMSYGGQTVRLLLTDSLTRLLKATDDPGAVPVTAAQLNALFDNTNALWSEISTNKKLSDKVSGLLDPNIVSQIRAWFDTVETRSSLFAGSAAAVTTDDGIYIPEAIEKTLMGAMMYAEAVGYLVNKVPVADNTTIKPGEGTTMEHNWDEAFGYFGAAHDYHRQSYTQRRTAAGVDMNGDGKIDPSTERTFFNARYAATADTMYATFTSQNLELGNKIMKAFIDGRKAIAEKDEAKRDAARSTILANWEKIAAGNATRYAGVIKPRLVSGDNINVQWIELKGFVDMTQYYNQNLLGAANYATIKGLIGEKPADITAEKLDQIITIIKNAYSF